MKSRKNIFLYAGFIVVLLFVPLWYVLYQSETASPERLETMALKEPPIDIVERQGDTLPVLVDASSLALVAEEQPVRKVKSSPVAVPVTLKSKVELNGIKRDTVFPRLTLSPLLIAEKLFQHTQPEEYIALHLTPARKTKEDLENAWRADTLPVKKGIDLLRIKKVGRFDRGIVNYRFMPKGQTMFGLDASFWDFDSKDSKLLFAYLDNFTFNAKTISVNPFIGYFFKDNQSIGMKWGYRQTSGRLENVSVKIDDDVNFSLKDLGLKEEIYSCTFFHRSYIGLDAGKRFGLFNETSLNIGYGKSVFARGTDETLKETTTKILEARLGISPGLAVFIMENVSVECSIGIMGFKYRQENQTNNQGEKGQHLNGGANFRVNLFDLNLGLIISL